VWNESGFLQYAPHQIAANTNWGTRTADVPAGWSAPSEEGTVIWADVESYSIAAWSVSTSGRHFLRLNETTEASETYTAFVYIHASDISNSQPLLQASNTSGTDGDILQSDFDALGGAEGWYAVGFTMGPADTGVTLSIGLGTSGGTTGTLTLSRPGIVKGLIRGVGVNVPAFLGAGVEPLGRWVGTDDGDEPLYDAARFDHDPGNSDAAIGILMEEQRTNVCLQSEDISTTWATVQTPVITTNTDVAPDGNTTADTIEDNNASGLEAVRQFFTIPDDSSTWCGSIYVLKDSDTARFPQFRMQLTGGSPLPEIRGRINTQTGATHISLQIGTGSITVFDAGLFWRVAVTVDNNSLGNVSLQFHIYPAVAATLTGADDNAVTGSMVVWGAQVENAAFPTSYIPTTAAEVTRSSDNCITDDVSWFNEVEGTFLCEALELVGDVSNTFVFGIGNASNSDRHRVRRSSDDTVRGFSAITSGTTYSTISIGTMTFGVPFKYAYAYSQDDTAGSLDGEAVVVDGVCDLPLSNPSTQLRLATHTHDQGAIDTTLHIGVLKYWPVRKPNTFLISESI